MRGWEKTASPGPSCTVFMARKLRLLSLDGGGVRGLSSLLLLQQFMLRVNGDGSEKAVKPCEYFDMICGTSTGG